MREIPYNYTSAEDNQIITHLLGKDVAQILDKLKHQRVTGRSSRLMMRFIGDIFIHLRNPFLYQELLDSKQRRQWFLQNLEDELNIIRENANKNANVLTVLEACVSLLKKTTNDLDDCKKLQKNILQKVGSIVGTENINFDPFSIISHTTDATDWRLYMPVAIVYPTRETDVTPVLKALEELKLYAIPRGAGTGLSGGCVPLYDRTVIINTEKLNKINGIKSYVFKDDAGQQIQAASIAVEAGVITHDAMAFASQNGLVFATDPTSSWGCTIGGNIAENAGGKTAVLWGTAIDNLISFRIAMPGGQFLEVRRENHPMRKILPKDSITYRISRADTNEHIKTIHLTGLDIRKSGIWKDITNKTLGKLPGVQKEGTDGVITHAEFILYPQYKHKKTFSLEFFGEDLKEASRVIEELTNTFHDSRKEVLIALEHFDDQYIKAIKYKVKAARPEIPKAVLLIDLVGNTTEEIERGTATIQKIVKQHKNTSLVMAKDEDEAERFWKDRKNLGAIASRTNAFKLNEDIVIPIHSLSDFAQFTGQLILNEERFNQQNCINSIREYFIKNHVQEEPDWFREKTPQLLAFCDETVLLLKNAGDQEIMSLNIVQNLLNKLNESLQGYSKITEELMENYTAVRSRLITIATHMHAGDGNVHVNIPVFSNEREMLLRAEYVVDQIMEKAVALGGVVSGEHGIGITKLKYLDKNIIDELDQYRKEVDPRGIMNPGKLSDLTILDRIFTPSFNILELEARILKHASLETLATKISKCIRCTRCKRDCCVFYPYKNLFYHPRNKNLAVASIIEALLYDAQRARSTNFELLRHLSEIADHCTICHKCLKPCPVDIDTGMVSILEREILSNRHFKKTPLATKAVLKYLHSRSQGFNSLFRSVFMKAGSHLQQLGVRIFPHNDKSPGIFSTPVAIPDNDTLRTDLPECLENQAIVIEPPGEAIGSVFYFPGCGSERIFSSISKAAVYLLLKSGIRVLIPPPFLCCGFPFLTNAKNEIFEEIKLRNTIIFSQLREMFNYLAFDACIVTCGTCRDALEDTGLDAIFQSNLADLAEFLLQKKVNLKSDEPEFLYHAPCHDSLKGRAVPVMKKMAGISLTKVLHCCSEAGTLSLSRPDISNSMLQRKTEALRNHKGTKSNPKTILTNCPSCVQGLHRQKAMNIQAKHIAVLLAEKTGGADWKKEYLTLIAKAKTITY